MRSGTYSACATRHTALAFSNLIKRSHPQAEKLRARMCVRLSDCFMTNDEMMNHGEEIQSTGVHCTVV